jgi:GT2 family glycosyltransferase
MAFQVIIPSATAANLVACVRQLLDNEPTLPAADIIVIDDGARGEAEPQLPGLTWISGLKPFNFARNVNLGLSAAEGDVFLLNDDALLASHDGFSRLEARVTASPDVGLCSAAIRGVVGNPNQAPRPGTALRYELRALAFVCVFLPHRTRTAVGLLDERFAGYGFEDDDYCRRVARAGRQLAVYDDCLVDHTGQLPSTFRTRRDYPALHAHNRRLYQEKWAQPDPAPTAACRAVSEDRLSWTARIVVDRAAFPAAGLDRAARWYVGFHDADGVELWRQDAERAELRRAVAASGERIVIERRFQAARPPARWTIWPMDQRGQWLENISGAIDPGGST